MQSPTSSSSTSTPPATSTPKSTPESIRTSISVIIWGRTAPSMVISWWRGTTTVTPIRHTIRGWSVPISTSSSSCNWRELFWSSQSWYCSYMLYFPAIHKCIMISWSYMYFLRTEWVSIDAISYFLIRRKFPMVLIWAGSCWNFETDTIFWIKNRYIRYIHFAKFL